MLKKNIGTPDRVIRLFFALLLLWGGIKDSNLFLLLLSAFVFFEALYGWCVFYQIIGKNTCPK